MDHFSKYTNIYPMRDQTAHTVAKHLFEEYITEHGVPESLHTDQGRQFESRIVQDLCEKLGIHKSRSSPYHPQGAGIVERANRVIKDQLAKYIAHQGDDWDKHIHQLQLAYNTSVHTSTGLTPYFIMHGREARTPASLTCPVMAPSFDSPQEYVTDVYSRLRKAFQHARQKTDQAQRRQKKDYDASTRTIQYALGDLVWLHDPVNARHKLEPNWKGPFEVISASPDGLNYKIADIHNESVKKVVHHNRLKLFRSRAYLQGKGPPASHPPSSDQRRPEPIPSSSQPPSSQRNPETLLSSQNITPSASIEIQWSANPQTDQFQQPDDPHVPEGQQPIHPGRNETDQQPRSDSSSQSLAQPTQRLRLDNSDQPSWSEESRPRGQSSTQFVRRQGPDNVQHQQQATEEQTPNQPVSQGNPPEQLINPTAQLQRPGPSRKNSDIDPEVIDQQHEQPLPAQQPTGESVSQPATSGEQRDANSMQLPHTRYGRCIHPPKRYSDYQM